VCGELQQCVEAVVTYALAAVRATGRDRAVAIALVSQQGRHAEPRRAAIAAILPMCSRIPARQPLRAAEWTADWISGAVRQ
jgi:hypothetical protein